VQLHFGGGTPTMMPPAQLDRIIGAIHEAFPPDENAEMSIEIDPVVTKREHLETVRKHGLNRISIGVQDFSDEVQEAVARMQSAEISRGAFAMARELGFESVNIDIMYGLPRQTEAHLERSAREVVALGSDRIALFGYAHVPWIKPHQKKLEIYDLPTAEQRWKMFGAARQVFLEEGYHAIGMDHFAKPGDELAQALAGRRLRRNFQGYTVLDAVHLIGFGMTAISDAGGAFIQNHKKLSDYYAAVEQGELATERGMDRSADDNLRQAVITGIMCNLYLSYADIEERFAGTLRGSFADHFAKELEALAALEHDGLLVRSEGAIEVPERGRHLVRNIAAVFDTYLEGNGEGTRFSRTI